MQYKNTIYYGFSFLDAKLIINEFSVVTLQPLYNMVHYNMVLDITRSKDGSQKCIDYIEK